MVRPCFLVIDHEHAGSLSTRKLVIESAKLNVLTAFSGEEALATLKKFPQVDGIVLDSVVSGVGSEELVRQLKEEAPDLPIIVINIPDTPPCPGADYVLESFEPVSLLALLGKLEPRRTEEIRAHDDDLRRKERSDQPDGQN